jgi:hypothetical protein
MMPQYLPHDHQYLLVPPPFLSDSADSSGVRWNGTGIHWTPLDSTGLHWNPSDSTGLRRSRDWKIAISYHDFGDFKKFSEVLRIPENYMTFLSTSILTKVMYKQIKLNYIYTNNIHSTLLIPNRKGGG